MLDHTGGVGKCMCKYKQNNNKKKKVKGNTAFYLALQAAFTRPDIDIGLFEH